jgi:hypothetical protein
VEQRVTDYDSAEQLLVDICFAIGLAMDVEMAAKSDEDKAEWVRSLLAIHGFQTESCGSSWGRLLPVYYNA